MSGSNETYARDVIARLRATFEPQADREWAVGAAAYMRDQFPFLGVPTPLRRRLAKEVFRDLPPPDEDRLETLCLALWEEPERELQYVACDHLRKHIGVVGPGFIEVLEHLITTKSWWDTVDALAAHAVGPLVHAHPELLGVMDAWIEETDLWLARTAILHQLTYGAATDSQRLFDYCRRRATDREFFLRKAIGWALRSYAAHAPAAVDRFVAATPELSGLSRREALKGVNRARQAAG